MLTAQTLNQMSLHLILTDYFHPDWMRHCLWSHYYSQKQYQNSDYHLQIGLQMLRRRNWIVKIVSLIVKIVSRIVKIVSHSVKTVTA